MEFDSQPRSQYKVDRCLLKTWTISHQLICSHSSVFPGILAESSNIIQGVQYYSDVTCIYIEPVDLQSLGLTSHGAVGDRLQTVYSAES